MSTLPLLRLTCHFTETVLARVLDDHHPPRQEKRPGHVREGPYFLVATLSPVP